jgi:hypothetical protein
MDTVTRYALAAAVSLAIFPSIARADQTGPIPVQSGAPVQSTAKATPPDPVFGRWLDIDAAAISLRYRLVRGTSDTRFNQAQTQDVLRGRVKFDSAARFAVGFTVQSGSGFPSSWNNTGLGTGDRRSSIFLKHLFADVTPVRGVEIQYGGLGLARSENTEMTAYDNDGYIVGGRASVRRPKDVFFDEITVTAAYLGDLTTSNVFTRLEHLDRHNFTQVLVAKKVNAHVQASTDYVDDDLEGGVWRAAGRFTIGARFVDSLRAEYGVRVTEGPHDTAAGVTGEKTVGKVLFFAGISRVGRLMAVLNGDRYAEGTHIFTGGSWRLPADLVAGWFLSGELSGPRPSNNRMRLDLVVGWNALSTMRRARLVH